MAALSSRFGVHPPMIHGWPRALLEGASGLFERGGEKAPEIDEEQVEALPARIKGGDGVAVASDFCPERSDRGSAREAEDGRTVQRRPAA